MSRLSGYYNAVHELSEKVNTRDQVLAFMFGEINISLAMIADHLDQIEKDNKALIREVGKRK